MSCVAFETKQVLNRGVVKLRKTNHFHNQAPYISPLGINSYPVRRGKSQSYSNLLLIVLLLAAYPLARLLPPSWGWENGPLEWFQASILSLNVIIALWNRHRTSDQLWRQFWLALIPFWSILFCRETSWFAAFLPYQSFDALNGPTLMPLRSLWYRPIVYPSIGILFLTTIFLVIKHKLLLIPARLVREKKFPALPLALAVVAICAATCFEKHFFPLPDNLGQLMEEYFETIFYLGLSATVLEVYARAKNSACLTITKTGWK
jgi:hypothetical protein